MSDDKLKTLSHDELVKRGAERLCAFYGIRYPAAAIEAPCAEDVTPSPKGAE